MAPAERRRQAAPSPDHDLLVRIDEQVKNLISTVKEQAGKTEAKIDRLALEKADRVEIQEIKHLLETKLPQGTFESTLAPLAAKMDDHESRVRYLEKVVFRFVGAMGLGQIAFNAWVMWVVTRQ